MSRLREERFCNDDGAILIPPHGDPWRLDGEPLSDADKERVAQIRKELVTNDPAWQSRDQNTSTTDFTDGK
jgi:hypothetical protein